MHLVNAYVAAECHCNKVGQVRGALDILDLHVPVNVLNAKVRVD